MVNDCQRFRNLADLFIANAGIHEEMQLHGNIDDEWTQAGHDFWLTRNGHGAGFWDGDWPEPYASELTRVAKEFGGYSLYLGDYGLIYGMNG
jgi:hypothetical protein